MVAREAGVTKGGLLHHFPNKSALLSAVLRRRDEHTMTIVPVEDDDPVAALKGLVELAAYNASRPGVVELYCVLSAEATTPDHPAHSYFVERYEWVRERLVRTFRLLQQQGSLRPKLSPESAARSTVAVMDGLQLQWLLDRHSLDMAEEFRRHLDSLVTFEFG
jgi:AcrR family transcriptional regulator